MISTKSLSKKSTSVNIRKSKATFDIDVAKLTGTCMKGLMDSIPQEFCWRVGVLPGCPSGWTKEGALCYNCPSGQTYRLSGCYQGKNFKGFAKIFSMFDPRVTCPSGKIQVGALCVVNCATINMKECGIGACATDAATCGTEIGMMVIDVLQGIADGVSFVLSFGATSATAPLKNMAKKAASGAAKKGLQIAKKALTGSLKDTIRKTALKKVRDTIKDGIVGGVTEGAVEQFCNGVYDKATKKVQAQDPNSVGENVLDALDIFQIKTMTKTCPGSKTNKDDALKCAQAALEGAAVFDPTGLLSIAATFMKPAC